MRKRKLRPRPSIARSPHRHLLNRGGYWVYIRRVPKAYQPFDSRKVVIETTGVKVTDDPRANRAGRVAERINAAMVAYWEGMAAGAQQAAKARYDEACRKARSLGVTYLEEPAITSLPTDDLMARVERAERELAALRAQFNGGAPPQGAIQTAVALFGGVKRTTIPLSKLFDEFEKLRAVPLQAKTHNQLMKWADVRRRPVANFIKVVGDKDLADLTRETDGRDLRDWYQQRILAGEMKPETANIEIGYLATMIKELNLENRWGLEPIFAHLRFKQGNSLNGDDDDQRPPFSTNWIRDKLLAPSALDGLPPEARRAVYLMIETGLRPREIVMLGASTIRLDGPIPYVHAHSKNKNSKRDMPLVGVALEAMRLQPGGFATYHDNPNRLSAHVNGHFALVGLREPRADGKETTLYSLRHSFKDRLRNLSRDARPGDEMINMLMGHSSSTENYGSGYMLEQKKEALDKIAFVNYPTEL